jgi:hypothetical protein
VLLSGLISSCYGQTRLPGLLTYLAALHPHTTRHACARSLACFLAHPPAHQHQPARLSPGPILSSPVLPAPFTRSQHQPRLHPTLPRLSSPLLHPHPKLPSTAPHLTHFCPQVHFGPSPIAAAGYFRLSRQLRAAFHFAPPSRHRLHKQSTHVRSTTPPPPPLPLPLPLPPPRAHP